MKLACVALCGAGMIGVAGCYSNKPAGSLETKKEETPSVTTRAPIPAYSYQVVDSVHDGFAVTLNSLKYECRYPINRRQVRESASSAQLSISLTVHSVDENASYVWRQSKLPTFSEVVDHYGENVFVQMDEEDYRFQKPKFPQSKRLGPSENEGYDLGSSSNTLILTKLPRAVVSLRGEAYVEVAPSFAIANASLAIDPIEFEICDGVKGKAWRTHETRRNQPAWMTYVEVHISSESQAQGAMVHEIELSNSKTGRQPIKLGQSIYEQTKRVENGVLIFRGATDLLQDQADPVNVRVSVIPVVKTLTLPFNFQHLPGSEP